MTTDQVTLELMRQTGAYKEAEARLEESRLLCRKASVQRLQILEQRYTRDTQKLAQQVAKAREKVVQAEAALRAARSELGDAEGASLGLSCRIERERNRCRAELTELLPAGFEETLRDLQHRRTITQREVKAREIAKRNWLGQPERSTATNLPDVLYDLVEIDQAARDLEACRLAVMSTQEISDRIADVRQRFQLDHMEGVRQVTVQYT